MAERQAVTIVDTLIVSDFHLGSKFTRLFFWLDGSNPKVLLDVLARYKFCRLVVDGDIFHGSHAKLNKNEKKVLDKLREYYKPDSGVELVVILGNHDGKNCAEVERKLGVPCQEEYFFCHHGEEYLVIHGHQFDESLKNKRGMFWANWGEWLTRVTGTFWFFKKKFNAGIWDGIHRRTTEQALAYAKEKKVSYIFIGHSHCEGITRQNGVTCVNSGCWNDAYPALVVLHAGQAEPEVHRFTRGGESIEVI